MKNLFCTFFLQFDIENVKLRHNMPFENQMSILKLHPKQECLATIMDWQAKFNKSIVTFTANALSVALLTFPMMPIVLKWLRWWLSPSSESTYWTNIIGIVTIIALYVGEVAIFWT